ncbi:MAG TPA: DUF1684 domain-containing protein [Pyrinomonadaceae bacterium]|nr:DUF1684 domain-containing protein [Pyrinomonadaceae bacterium]
MTTFKEDSETPAGLPRGRARRVGLFALCLAFVVGCGTPHVALDEGAYLRELEDWKAKRFADLKSENGWLTLVGLFWLKEGENKLGSDPANDIVLPEGKAPRFAGSVHLEGGLTRLEGPPDSGVTTEDDKPVTSLALQSDADGSPTVLRLGSLSFHVIRRGERFALRVRDREHPARLNFQGTQYFPASQTWRIAARFEPYNPPKPVRILNITGMESDEPSPGALVFEADGRTHRLDAITEKDNPNLFVIFADQTSGRETYGAGRYLYVEPPDSSGRVMVDFNKAYSPPCAFTAFATCPLPPPQNRLALRVEAGEKYEKH